MTGSTFFYLLVKLWIFLDLKVSSENLSKSSAKISMITSFVDAFFKAFFSNVRMKFDIESLNVSQNKFVPSAVQVLDKPHNIYPNFKFCGVFFHFLSLYISLLSVF